MLRKEDQPVEVKQGLILKEFNRPTDNEDVWVEGDFTRINATEVGTPCLRYLVRQPDGHRDVDDLDKGEYSFGAFGFRSEIGGTLKQIKRDRPMLGNLPLIAYFPESDGEPFGKDFFGISSPSLFNYEVLDRFQQKLTLVGVAHFHLHAPDMNGAVIVSFNQDGSLRYIETKQGQRRNHDSILLYKDKVEFKVGSHLTGIRRRNREPIFGVPKWAFSEDVSTKISVEFNRQNGVEVTRNLAEESELRLGHPTNPEQFSNRRIGTEVLIGASELLDTSLDLDFLSDSSTIGVSRSVIAQKGRLVSLTLDSVENGTRKTLSADLDLFQKMASGMEILPVGMPDSLDVNTVADYSEYLFMRFHTLLGKRNSDGIFLTQDEGKI